MQLTFIALGSMLEHPPYMIFLAWGGIIWHFLWLLPKCGTRFRVPDVSAGSVVRQPGLGTTSLCPLCTCFSGGVKNSTSLWSWISQQELGFLMLHWFWEHWESTSSFSVWEVGAHPAEIRASKMGLASTWLQQLPVSLNKENNQIWELKLVLLFICLIMLQAFYGRGIKGKK